METGEILNDWGKASVALVFKKKRPKGYSRELWAAQPHCGPWANDGASPLGRHFKAMKENKIMGNSQHGSTKGE